MFSHFVLKSHFCVFSRFAWRQINVCTHHYRRQEMFGSQSAHKYFHQITLYHSTPKLDKKEFAIEEEENTSPIEEEELKDIDLNNTPKLVLEENVTEEEENTITAEEMEGLKEIDLNDDINDRIEETHANQSVEDEIKERTWFLHDQDSTALDSPSTFHTTDDETPLWKVAFDQQKLTQQEQWNSQTQEQSQSHQAKNVILQGEGGISISELRQYLQSEKCTTEVIDVKGLSLASDYIMIVSGQSRLMRALAKRLHILIKIRIRRQYSQLDAEQLKPLFPVIDSPNSDDWIVLEHGDVTIHFMTEATKSHYDLQGYWHLIQQRHFELSQQPHSIVESLGPITSREKGAKLMYHDIPDIDFDDPSSYL